MSNRSRRRPSGDAEDRAWASYGARFRAEVMPQLLSSAVFLGLYDGERGGEQEVRFATSLGMMLLYDKPIILVATPGAELPERLRRIADEVVEGDMLDPRAQDALADAMRRVLKR